MHNTSSHTFCDEDLFEDLLKLALMGTGQHCAACMLLIQFVRFEFTGLPGIACILRVFTANQAVCLKASCLLQTALKLYPLLQRLQAVAKSSSSRTCVAAC